MTDPSPPFPAAPAPRTLFWSLLAFALLLRIAAAWTWPNVHQPDEVFQTLEPAHRLWFGYSVVSWEWREGIRSWLIPGLLAPIIGLVTAFGGGQPAYAGAIDILMTLLSLSVVAVGFGVGGRFYGRASALLIGLLCAVWFEFVYFAPKTLTEVIAAHVLIIAIWFILTAPHRLILIGMLLGLTGIIRFHTGPMVLVAAIWVCRADITTRWPRLLAGAAIPILFQAVLDWITLGAPLQSIWLNLWINVGQARSEFYGTLPFYWYPGRFLIAWGPVFPFILVAALLGARRAPLLGWMVIVHVAAHSLIAHKEMRFLYPAMPLLIILAGLGACRILSRFSALTAASPAMLAGVFVALTGISIAGATNPGFANNWISNRGGQSGMAWLRDRADLCGLALAHGPKWPGDWTPSGGYFRLHRNVPIYLAPEAAELAALTTHYNYALLAQPLGDRLHGYERLQCWTGVVGASTPANAPAWCVYHRPGTCVLNQDATINRVLPLTNE